jgi:hypothetical protein
MRHDWVFDVLSDLLAFATRNDLPRLADKVVEAIEAARSEIAALSEGTDDPPPSPSPSDRRMH